MVGGSRTEEADDIVLELPVLVLERFNPQTNTWTALSQVPEFLEFDAATAIS